jgi:hypothetical protein
MANLEEMFKSNQPFPHLSLQNFFDEEFLSKIRKEVLKMKFNEKNNDLYQFKQSDDLKAINTPQIA